MVRRAGGGELVGQAVCAKASRRVRETWGKLTDDDVDVVAGHRDQVEGRITERYGRSAELVEREVQEFEKKLIRAD